jgi:hypothetical protein
MAMQAHQQRVVDEKRELDAKISKLVAFYDTTVYAGLDETERVRLSRQGQIMSEYSDVLGERIAAFGAVKA